MKIYFCGLLFLYTLISCSKEVKSTDHQEVAAQFKTVGQYLHQQENDTWSRFWNSDTTKFGFKDKKGNIQIEPRFSSYSIADKFDNIICVTEEKGDEYKTYYLTKNGKIVGIDSSYIFDNTPDCESEGFIRFSTNEKVGVFNRNGKVIIPAVYNYLSQVNNGLLMGLVGAEKKYWDTTGHSGCNHYSFVGGKEVLIDTNNQLYIDNFKHEGDLNFFSLKVSTEPDINPVRVNFKGKGGLYYSFIDFNKEFSQWLKESLLKNLTKENLINSTHKKITSWKSFGGWINEDNITFINNNYGLIKEKLSVLNTTNAEYNIFHEDLNPYIYDPEEYPQYFNNCGQSKSSLYPVQNVVITYKKFQTIEQDHFEFLRTDEGYKLIQVSIKTGELK